MLEHAYTTDSNAAKIFYYLLQIAHTITQLLYNGSLLGRAEHKALGALKNLAYRLLEAWRNAPPYQGRSPANHVRTHPNQILSRYLLTAVALRCFPPRTHP
ncbi:MAG: hypothetical protein LDL33_14135 [Desulfomonile sp.]|nr:hypothetical protein [Desulfomonile sp.]